MGKLLTFSYVNDISHCNISGGLLGVSGKFPPAYIGGVFSGQAVGGIFASVTAVVMIALGTQPKDQAFFCFLVAVLFLAGSLIFYAIITRSEFYQYYLAEKVQTKDVALDGEFQKPDVPITEESEFIEKEKACIDSENVDGPHPPPTKVVIPHKGMVTYKGNLLKFPPMFIFLSVPRTH